MMKWFGLKLKCWKAETKLCDNDSDTSKSGVGMVDININVQWKMEERGVMNIVSIAESLLV